MLTPLLRLVIYGSVGVLLSLVLVTMFPQISLWLPRFFGFGD